MSAPKLPRRERKKQAALLKRLAQTAPLVVAMFLAGRADAAVYDVTTTTDGGAGSLRDAIDLANGAAAGQPDTINLPPGEYILTGAESDDANVSGDLDIRRAIGAGRLTIRKTPSTTGDVIIRSDGGDRVFDSRFSDVVFEDLTIADGVLRTQFASGGGVAAYGGRVEFNRVIFSNNENRGRNGQIGTGVDGSLGQGGAVALDSVANGAFFSDCRFENNIASGGDGGDGEDFSSSVTFFPGGDGGRGGDASGGAIWAVATNVSIAASSFVGNNAFAGSGGRAGETTATGLSGGAGGDARGGALYILQGFLSVSDSTFTDSLASGGNGGRGGTGFDGDSGGNGGAGGQALGGGIYAELADAVSLLNVDVTDSVASGGSGEDGGSPGGDGGAGGFAAGGGVYLLDAAQPAAIEDATIFDNSAFGGRGGDGSTNGGNGGGGGGSRGGGIYAENSGLSLLRSTVDTCDAIGGTGGRGEDSLTGDGGSGGAGGFAEGGGIYLLDAPQPAEIEDSTISNSLAVGGNGGNGGDAGVLTVDDAGTGGEGGRGLGGGIYAENTGLSLLGSDVIDCDADAGSGGVGGEGPSGDGGVGGLAAGGGIYLQDAPQRVDIEDSTIANNRVFSGDGGDGGSADGGNGGDGGQGLGGGIYAENTDLSLLGSSVDFGFVNAGSGGDGAGAGAGGGSAGGLAAGAGIYLKDAPLLADIVDSSISNNTAFGGNAGRVLDGAGGGQGGQSSGGGIYAENTNLSVLDSTVNGSTVDAGSGGDGGNGLANGGTGGAGGGAVGGGICLNGAPLSAEIQDSTISNNEVHGGDGGDGGDGSTANGGAGGDGGGSVGGGIYAANTNLTLLRLTVNGSMAFGGSAGDGGSGSSGGRGGDAGVAAGAGICLEGASQTLEIDASTISRNEAFGGRGGDGGFGSFFQGGAGGAGGAAGGGGVYFSDGFAAILNSTISSNTAEGGNGGAGGAGSTGTGVNGDGGLAGGGGIFAVGGTVDITAATIAANAAVSADADPSLGGGILGTLASFTLTSTLLADNNADVSPDYFGLDDATVSFSLIEDTDGQTPAGGTNNILDEESDLGPLGDNGGPTETHALPVTSIAVNAGNNDAGFAFDQRGDGFPRVVGGVADIGAFEAAVVVIPVPSVPDLLAASDSGASDTDNLTNVTLPTFVGTVDASVERVAIFVDGNFAGDGAVNAGAYSVTLANALTPGTRQITAVGLIDKASSDPSAALAVTVDLADPSGSIVVSNVNDASPPMLYTFTVAYFERVDTTSLDASDIAVTGPNGFSTNATFVSSAPVGGGTTATYTFVPPGGIWDTADNGSYNLAGLDGEVLDLAGNAGRAATASFDVNVTRVVTVPTDIALSTSVIAENQPAGTVIGTFTTADTAGDTHTYTLVAGTGSADNASFQIVGNQLASAASFDFETKSVYSIRVRTTDQTGQFFEEAFTINVTDVVENLAPIIDSIAFTPHDPVAGQTTTFIIAARDPEGQQLSFTIAYGDGSTGTTTNHIYAAAGTYTVTVTASDGQLSAMKTITVVVKPDDDDDDDDSVPDVLEDALGSNTDDSTSVPNTAKANLDIGRVAVALNFRRAKADTITITGTLPLAANFKPQGQRIAVNVGGVAKVFSLDGQSLTPTPFSSDVVKFRANKAKGELMFTLTLKKGDFDTLLADEGLTNSNESAKNVSLPIQVYFGAVLYEGTAQLKYTAKQGKTGKASGK